MSFSFRKQRNAALLQVDEELRSTPRRALADGKEL